MKVTELQNRNACEVGDIGFGDAFRTEAGTIHVLTTKRNGDTYLCLDPKTGNLDSFSIYTVVFPLQAELVILDNA